jgi:hypothetical protein
MKSRCSLDFVRIVLTRRRFNGVLARYRYENMPNTLQIINLVDDFMNHKEKKTQYALSKSIISKLYERSCFLSKLPEPVTTLHKIVQFFHDLRIQCLIIDTYYKGCIDYAIFSLAYKYVHSFGCRYLVILKCLTHTTLFHTVFYLTRKSFI